MFKEKLFERIREEDVIIWAGAGLSISSGYPSGQNLKSILYESLSKGEKEIINSDMSLMDLTQAILDIQKSRNHLVTQLYRIFSGPPPTPSDVHGKIAQIPHFKNIFTTNYDSLLESAINNSVAITNEKQIAIIGNNNNTKVFKMHGHLQDPDSLVITSSDYNKIFSNNTLNNTLWTHAKALVATKTVLFLGYSVEDSNFNVLLEGLTSSVGNNRKEFYFVAPNIDKLKIIQLESKNIRYINSTAETFIDELYENIKANIIKDLRDGKVSSDTFSKFMGNHDYNAILTAHGDSFDVLKIQSGKPIIIEGKIGILDERKAIDFNKHFDEKPSKPFVLKVNEVKNFELSYSGIIFDMMHNAAEFKFTRIPTKEGPLEIIFEDGSEFFPHYFLFVTNIHIEVKLKFVAGEVLVNLKDHDGGFVVGIEIEHNKECIDTRSEIEFFSFLTRALGKKGFTIISDTGKKSTWQPLDVDMIEEFIDLDLYFKHLKEIEDFFEVKFKNFTFSQARASLQKRDVLMSIIKGITLPINLGENIEIEAEKSFNKEIVSKFSEQNEQKYFQIIIDDKEELELHGKSFEIGKKEISVPDAICLNEQEVSNNGNKIVLSSIGKKGTIKYLRNDNPPLNID